MGNIVLELQQELLEKDCDILNVLRKAHVISSKLNLTEFDKWIMNELNGYDTQENNIPEYRQMNGVLKAKNPYRGWIPAVITDKNNKSLFNSVPIYESVSALIDIEKKSNDGYFYYSYPPEVSMKICSQANTPTYMEASLLHDIICLANNRADRDSYLIIGVRDKTFEIVGVENDTNRKNQQWMVDFLSSKNFAGQLRPRVEVRTIQLSGHEIDVFIIKNSTDVPYYLLKDYTDKDYKNHKRKTVHASHIYTRVMDNNTHADQTADIRDVEYLWKKRFGLLQTPLEQVKILLHQFDDWEEEDGIYYHKTFPQYTITLEDEEDEDGLCRESNRMFYHHVQTDNSAYYGTIKIYCFGTQLFSCQFTHLDGHRMMAPCPESEFIHYRRHGENIHLKYYVTDSIRYLLLRFLEHHIGESNGLEAQDATRKLLDVVLVFDTENNMKTFSNYIATHLNDFDLVVSNQREPLIRDETELAKTQLAKEIRNSLALKEIQLKWHSKS